ncbi:Yip1 family protein [Shimia abyssi]|uniref:Yip1-like protein n=1 Tax=Shimia abyssi TaxID=1662395 RepID=A0A2P8FC67_9RHOB|nr:Yip1 family protein [Shimia abyssi]PSL19319.1 Yip1-like protein [Shimia abyssi]
MSAFLKQLFVMTLQRPSEAAQVLIAQRIERNVAWLLLALAVVLNTLAYFVSITLFPPPGELTLSFLMSPVSVATMLGAVVLAFIFGFHSIGRIMGGTAEFDQILLLMGWLQYLRLLVQAGSIVLMLFLPGLASFFVMAAGLYGAWIVLNFMNVAHGFNSMGKAVVLLIFTLIALSVVISVLLSFLGVVPVGIQ